MKYPKVLVLVLAFLVVVPSLHAQSTISGYVTGVVSAPSKAVVSNAAVTLTNPSTSFSQGVKTGADGVFRFEYVPPGDYKLNITAAGFSTTEQTLAVTVGQSTTASVELTVGSSSSTVVVQGQANSIQPEHGDIT